MKIQFFKLSIDLITDQNITSNEFRIYTYLMSRYNKSKNCAYPSIEVIAKKVNISERTVNTAIKNLVKLGYMIIEKKKGVNGNYNEYKEFRYLISDKNFISTKTTVEEITVKQDVEEKVKKESDIKPIIVSDCKESGLQMTIDDVKEVKIKQHPNNSKIVKETKIGLTPYYCEAFSHIDEVVLEMVLKKEKAKTATLLLKKCIRISKQVGIVFGKEFINKVLKFKDYKDEYDLTSENNELYIQYINKKYGIAN